MSKVKSSRAKIGGSKQHIHQQAKSAICKKCGKSMRIAWNGLPACVDCDLP